MKNKYLAIIPARGGSKRLPRKNVLELNGKPLLAWTIEAAKQSQTIDAIAVTSDDSDVLAITKQLGVKAIERPSDLATDTATTFDTIEHALKNISESYNYVVLLQPTSPLRNCQHIDEAIEKLEQKQADAIISVCRAEHSPLWMNTLPSDDSMQDFLPQTSNKRGQELPQYYRLNGAIYICKTERLLIEKTFFIADNIYAYVMDEISSVDIDTMQDFLYAEFLMRNTE